MILEIYHLQLRHVGIVVDEYICMYMYIYGHT